MSTLLAIDANCIGHISKHAMRGLNHGDQATGVIFGFLGQIFRLAKRFDTVHFVFAWDSRKSLRKKIYPEYKINRIVADTTPEENEERLLAFKQFVELRQYVLPKFGFKHNLQHPGYEADDILASVVKHTSFGQKVVVSTDHDLYQLLDSCSVFNPITKKTTIRSEFVLENAIEPMRWAEVKALAGCSSDNVEGIIGIGEKTAIKYLNGHLSGKTKAYQKIVSKESCAIAKRNRVLVRLPYPGLEAFSFKAEDFVQEFREQDFVDICRQYNFRSFLQNLPEWKSVFKMM